MIVEFIYDILQQLFMNFVLLSEENPKNCISHDSLQMIDTCKLLRKGQMGIILKDFNFF